MTFHAVLSPHQDDAPLTMGGTIHQLTSRGDRVLIITTMAGSLPDPLPDSPIVRSLHAAWEGGDDPIALRRAEDSAAAKALGAEITFLDMHDCIYRTVDGVALYPTQHSLFDTVHPDDIILDTPSALIELVKDADVFYAPLGAGRHVDHQIAHGWTEELAAMFPKLDVRFYTDYPYAEVPTALDEVLARVKGVSPLPDVELTEADMRAKIDAIACYTSQISTYWKSLDDMEAHIRSFFTARGTQPAHERFWKYQGQP